MSNNIGNKLCICGSGKKYKKCYSVFGRDNNCSVYLKEKHTENINIIQKFIDELVNEYSTVAQLLQKNNNCSRSLLIIIFSFMDSMSRIWSIYTGADNLKKNESFKNWYSSFCYNVNNKYFGQSTGYPPVNIMYSFRSSISHSFALKNIYGSHQIMIINGMGFDSTTLKYRERAKNLKDLNRLIIVCPYELFLLSVEGTVLMINEMSKNILDLKNLTTLNLLAIELHKEGCSYVPLNI